MNLLEIGGYAGAIIVVVTLSQKLISMITAIQRVILRIKRSSPS